MGLLVLGFIPVGLLNAAEWKVEPRVGLNVKYADNVKLQTNDLAENSVGSTFSPSVIVKGEEHLLWDMSFDARGRLTRFAGAEDADSNSVFFILDANRKSERVNWGLKTLFNRSSNFDTDFEVPDLPPDIGLTSDRTDRTTLTITPSVSRQMSETSQIRVGLSLTDVSYDEVTNVNLKNYEYNSLNINASWSIAQNHSVGFTGSYAEYDSPQSPAFSFDQIVVQVDYTYILNPMSNLAISIGERSIDSTTVGVSNEDRGAVVNISYVHQSEKWSHNILADRTVIPSSFGSAQEKNSFIYRMKYKNSERLTTNLLINTAETTTIIGVGEGSSNDRRFSRVQPSLQYRINKNWSIKVQYQYLSQTFIESSSHRTSNSVLVNLFLNWPKLATTY